jgi:inorganic pyrophosphatase
VLERRSAGCAGRRVAAVDQQLISGGVARTRFMGGILKITDESGSDAKILACRSTRRNASSSTTL